MICERAETTRDCPFSHDWLDGRPHTRQDHPPVDRRPMWLRRQDENGARDLTGQVTR